MLKEKRSEPQTFSYEAEKNFYIGRLPREALPYLHLEPYLRCWLDPERVFGGKRVLDIGAGECTYTRLVADRFGPHSIVACELFYERMLPAFRAYQNPVLKAVAGDCFHLPFRNRSFDVVMASLVLHQLPNLKDVVMELARVLKPGGLFVGWNPNPFNPFMLYHFFVKPCSPNQYLFWPHKVCPVFEDSGFTATTRFFYAKLPWVRNRFLGTCIGIVAQLQNGAWVD